MERFRIHSPHTTQVIGSPSPGVVSITICATTRDVEDPEQRHECRMNLGGLDSLTNTFLEWGDFNLTSGDRIVIEVLDEGESEDPVSTRQDVAEVALQSKKNSARSLACELGWTLIESEQ
jgi:hypothetical protein